MVGQGGWNPPNNMIGGALPPPILPHLWVQFIWRHVEYVIVKRNEAEAADYANGMDIVFEQGEGHFRFHHHSDLR